MTDAPFHPPGRHWGRIVLLVLALLVVAVVGGHAIWGMSSRNALDKQVAAYRAAGEPIELVDFAGSGVSDADNAVLALRSAARWLNKDSAAWKAYDKLDLRGPLTAKQRDAVVAVVDENPKVFRALDMAMTRKGADWQLTWRSPAITILLPDVTEQRELSRLVANHARLMRAQGDDAAALRDLGRLRFLADAMDQQPVLVSHMVANAMRTQHAQVATELASGLKIAGTKAATTSPAGAVRAEDVAAEIRALLDETIQRQGQRRGLLGERACELDTVRCILNGQLNPATLSGGGGGPPASVGVVLGYLIKPMAAGDGLLMIRHTTAVMEAAVAEDFQTFKQRAPRTPAEIVNDKFRHMLAAQLMPGLERAERNDFQTLAERRMAAVALAIGCYRADHDGQFPPTLEALVPKYLPTVPRDPMAAGRQPLRYLPCVEDPVVYSAGVNGSDDAGSEKSAVRHPIQGRWDAEDAVMHLQPKPQAADDPDAQPE